jgi:hypothetical protein
MAERRRVSVDFLGPPNRLRLAAADIDAIAAARGVHWIDSPHRGAAAPVLRRSRDPANTRLRLHPATPPGDYTAVLELADGSRREITMSVEARPRLRVSPSELRFVGQPGDAVSVRLLIENRGNVDIPIGDTLVTGIFDDDGIETALASTYRMETDDLNRIVGNVFARLREAHGGLLRLRVAEGAYPLARGERRVLVLTTTLNAKLKRGHRYHGVLEIGEHGIAVRIKVEGMEPDQPQGAER